MRANYLGIENFFNLDSTVLEQKVFFTKQKSCF